MLVPLRWLSEFTPHGLGAEELADLLTFAGLEVDAIHRRFAGMEKVVTARITEIAPHPDADKLKLVTVDKGGESQTVVCGAPNCRIGMVAPLAQVGAQLGEITVRQAKIRGVKSAGMLCSKRELGFGDDHSGLWDLPPDTPLGQPFYEALGLETQVLEISITPNRGDCLSILGVAREVSALTGTPLSLPPCAPPETEPAIETQAWVDIDSPEGCPRYAARLVRGVTIAPAPLWMADRLLACGVRSINGVVDVTNYLLLEMGQPLHAFDYHFLSGGRIVVRQAAEGERFVTLDDQERVLQAGMLLICDAEKPVALAGIMGGQNTEITDRTVDVLIESAFFDPNTTRRTSKRLGLATEASYRFERGIDRAGCALVADRAALLMHQVAGGRVAKGIIDNYPLPYQAPSLTLSVPGTARYLGVELTTDEVRGYLSSLGIEVAEGADADELVCRPPAHRTDLERPVDLTEEVARLKGFDKIPVELPALSMAVEARPCEQRVRAAARDAMAAQGFDEAICYSFAHPKAVEWLGLADSDPRRAMVVLLNPLSEDQSVLRTSLLPNLLAAARRNLAFRVADVALFEVGKCFLSRGAKELPHEPTHLAAALSGLAQPTSWWAGEQPVSFAHARGAVEYLAEALGLAGLSFDPAGPRPPYLDAAEWCQVKLEGEPLGEVGLLSAKAAKAFDLDRPVYVLDLDFDLIVRRAPDRRTFAPLPRYPEVVRDAAIVLDEASAAGEVLEAAREKAGKWLEDVTVFDVYRGKPLAKGMKSLGLRYTYRSSERTLTEEEVRPEFEASVQRVLGRFGGQLRTG